MVGSCYRIFFFSFLFFFTIWNQSWGGHWVAKSHDNWCWNINWFQWKTLSLEVTKASSMRCALEPKGTKNPSQEPLLVFLKHNHQWRGREDTRGGIAEDHHLDHDGGWVPKNQCFQTVGLEKTLESSLDCRDIEPVNPKGNQPLISIGRTDAGAEVPIFWPPDDAKCWLFGKDSDAGKD